MPEWNMLNRWDRTGRSAERGERWISDRIGWSRSADNSYSLSSLHNELAKFCLTQASFQRLLHLCAGFSVNGVSGDDDQIVSEGNFFFQHPPAFPHQPFGPVPLYAVSHLPAGQKRCPIIRKPVAAVKENNDPFSKGTTFPVNPIKVFLFSQYFPLQHFSFNTKRPHQRSLCWQNFSSSFASSLQHISSVLRLHSLSEAMLLFSLPLFRLVGHFHINTSSFIDQFGANLNFNLRALT